MVLIFFVSGQRRQDRPAKRL